MNRFRRSRVRDGTCSQWSPALLVSEPVRRSLSRHSISTSRYARCGRSRPSTGLRYSACPISSRGRCLYASPGMWKHATLSGRPTAMSCANALPADPSSARPRAPTVRSGSSAVFLQMFMSSASSAYLPGPRCVLTSRSSVWPIDAAYPTGRADSRTGDRVLVSGLSADGPASRYGCRGMDDNRIRLT